MVFLTNSNVNSFTPLPSEYIREYIILSAYDTGVIAQTPGKAIILRFVLIITLIV